METVGPPPADAELHLLPDLSNVAGRGPRREAGIVSIAAHAVLILLLALAPAPTPRTPEEPQPVRRVTPLIEPPTVLTQRTPSSSTPSKEFRGTIEAPRPRLPSRPAPPPAPVRSPPRQAVIPAQPPPSVTPPPAPVPEPPKPEPPKPEPPAQKEQPPASINPPLPTPPPQIVAEEKPRNPFERPGAPVPQVPPSQRQVPIPDPGAPIRGAAPGGAAGSMGSSPGAIQSGQGATIELPALLSDPQGVDFKPYLTRLLATVKRNWMAVWPESAKSGRRGRVGVQFAIGKDGAVQKVVFAFQSGADPLDRAAIAAISMSNPFPPLPGEFKGNRIVLQFNFSYNMPDQ